MQQHVTALGILFIGLGVLGLIGVLMVVVVFEGAAGIVSLAAGDEPESAVAIPIVGTVGAAIAVFILIMSLPDILVGIGLLGFRPWARILGIVLSILGLLHFPLGTIVGAYGLWVLFNRETEALFRSLPRAERPF